MLNPLEKRIIDLSYKHNKSHLSSCLTTVNVLDHIYSIKKKDDLVVLGNSHAALALWVVLEKYGFCNAEEMLEKYGTHAFRDIEHGVYVSGGSLGQPETIAVGMAMADRKKDIYLVTSDGACAEGSVWEALRTAAEQRLDNLRVTVIVNGQSAYGKIDTDYLEGRLKSFFPVMTIKADMYKYPSWLQNVDGHYVVMNDEQYKEIIK